MQLRRQKDLDRSDGVLVLSQGREGPEVLLGTRSCPQSPVLSPLRRMVHRQLGCCCSCSWARSAFNAVLGEMGPCFPP